MNKTTRTILQHGHIPTASMRINKTQSYVACRYCGLSAVIDSNGIHGALLTDSCTDTVSIGLAKQYLQRSK